MTRFADHVRTTEPPPPTTAEILADLARVKVAFQLRGGGR
jgi:hypothetical protein